jgi:hypothetical protein
VLWSGAPDNVWCTRTVQGPTSHSRENGGALRYNSPDCRVCQRATAIQHATVDSDSMNSAAHCAAEVRAAKLEGHRTVRCRKRTKPQRSTGLQTLTVGCCGGAPDSLQCMSGSASDCLVRPSIAASPTATLVVGGYKFPHPPQLQVSKISEHHIQYKSSSIHS